MKLLKMRYGVGLILQMAKMENLHFEAPISSVISKHLRQITVDFKYGSKSFNKFFKKYFSVLFIFLCSTYDITAKLRYYIALKK